MAQTIFEEMGGTYTQVGDYLLPDLKLPEEEQQPIGVWGQRHRRYLKEHRRTTYAALFTGGKLNVTESLKAKDMMLWVQKMNNIRNRAMEIVNSELIYRV